MTDRPRQTVALRPSRVARLVNLVGAGLVAILGILLMGAALVLGVWMGDPGHTTSNGAHFAYLWAFGLPGAVLTALGVVAVRSLARGSSLGLWIVAFVGLVLVFTSLPGREPMGATAGLVLAAAGLWGLWHSAREAGRRGV